MTLDFYHSPLLSAVKRQAERRPDKPALIVDDRPITYATLATKIGAALKYLIEAGVKPGDKIALAAIKRADFLYFYFAAHALGAINVVVDVESNPRRLEYIEKVANPSLRIGYRLSDGGVRSILYDEITLGDEGPTADELNLGAVLSAEQTADVMFTTGTTGNPKGVLLSHFNLFSSASNVNGFIGNDETDVEAVALPICHSFGLGRIRCNLINGSTVVLLKDFANVKRFFQTIEKYRVTGFGFVPAVWEYIGKISGTRIGKYADQIRYVEIGSAPMETRRKLQLIEMFPKTRICMHYGLTEASRSSFIEFHADKERLDSVGKPSSERVAIVVTDAEGNEVPNGTPGEICVKGNMATSSYLLPEDNVDAFFGSYLRTGDRGYKTDDGYLFLVGREKEQINVGGKKVSPTEVEDAICALGIEDCVCVAIEDKNGVLGEVVKARLLKPRDETLTFEKIERALIAGLERHKVPVEYEWIDEIPKTSSGKKIRLNIKE